MASSPRIARSSSSDEEEEDFGPVLPLSTRFTVPVEVADAVASYPKAPPLKRERLDPVADTEASSAQGSPHATTTPASATVTQHVLPENEVGKAAEAEEGTATLWQRYVQQGLPSAPLYERSFQHTALQDTYDKAAGAVAAVAVGTHRSEDGQALPVANTVHDICVHQDSLGALIATIDSVGVVRIWRKLPRGVFFLTELDKVFSFASKQSPDTAKVRRTYWAHAYTALQVLVFVCVEEEEEAAVEGMGDEVEKETFSATAKQHLVHVHLRQVNPVTFTLEERHTFSFLAPVQPIPSVLATCSAGTEATAHHTEASSAAVSAAFFSNGATTFLAYTRRPAFLTHQYVPYIAFFVTLPAAAAASKGGNGVVLCPCFSTFTATTAPATSGRGGEIPCYTPTRLSVANAIVLCAQQTHRMTRLGTAPCVLMDVTGVMDYCMIDATPSPLTESDDARGRCTFSGLTLKLIAGLAAVPAASPDARLWRQWIRFDRRQRTGFFSLVRDAQQALKAAGQENGTALTTTTTAAAAAAAGATATDAQVMPCAVQLSPDGKYVVVWSLRLLRTGEAALRATPSHQRSRIPSTQRTYSISLEECLHVFDFPTGVCIGKHVESLEKLNATMTEDISFHATQWTDYVQQRSRQLALDMHLEGASSSSKAQLYLLVPELPLSVQGVGLRNEDVGVHEKTVAGRRVRLYEVKVADANSAASTTAASAADTCVVRKLPHSVGELEPQMSGALDWRNLHLSEVPPHSPIGEAEGAAVSPATTFVHVRLQLIAPAERSHQTSSNRDPVKAGFASVERGNANTVLRVPMLLLRRAVAPSQDLKNLIATAPLGAALGAEGRKHLFLVRPSTHGSQGVGVAAEAEGMLLTSSAEASSTALLVYSSELPYTGIAVQRFLAHRKVQTQKRRGESGGENVETTPHPVHEDTEEQQQWWKLCSDLHRERDYACGSLLMTTVADAAMPASAPTDAVSVSASAAVAAQRTASSVHHVDFSKEPHPDAQVNQAPADECEDNEVETASTGGEAHASSSARPPLVSAAALAPAAAAKPPSVAETYAVNLLKEVVPSLDPSIGKSSSSHSAPAPVALVHVRGYGTVRVHLLPSLAPLATENFIRLSQRHYYDRLTFHRVIPHAIVQGGCPRGDGTGGESAFDGGAPFQDEALKVLPFFSYTSDAPCCWLCMANAGPNTNGSQFFFTVPGGDAMPWLNGHHTVFGYAVAGLEVVRAMSEAPRDAEDTPLTPIVMERVDILSR